MTRGVCVWGGGDDKAGGTMTLQGKDDKGCVCGGGGEAMTKQEGQ